MYSIAINFHYSVGCKDDYLPVWVARTINKVEELLGPDKC